MNRITDITNLLIGKACWGITGGEGTGSVIGIDIGEKIVRKKPLKNEYLSKDQKAYQGEYDLFVECSWRIDSTEEVICGSKDAIDNLDAMVKGLNRLVGQKIVSVEASIPAYDLEICFDNDLKLKIFCDETNESEGNDNYTIGTPNGNYIIGCKSQLNIEKRNYY